MLIISSPVHPTTILINFQSADDLWVWRTLNLWRCIFGIIGWFFVCITRPYDLLEHHLCSLKVNDGERSPNSSPHYWNIVSKLPKHTTIKIISKVLLYLMFLWNIFVNTSSQINFINKSILFIFSCLWWNDERFRWINVRFFNIFNPSTSHWGRIYPIKHLKQPDFFFPENM